jgi:MFS family permease
MVSVSDTFAAFRYRNYRLWFIGQLISMVGTWMQSVAQGFLVYSLTGSEAYLGYVGFISGVPSWLFMLYGGLVADRVQRRTLLVITQSAMLILAFILAALVFTNVVQPWHILVLAFLLGIANAFDTPARQSLVIELVDRKDMTNAIAFNATIFNSGMIIGPAIGALVYKLTGPGWCFTINGLSFIAVIAALLMMRIPYMPPPARNTSAMKAIAEAFRYVRGERLVLTLTLSVFVINIVGFGPITLLPAWSDKILGGGVTTNGLLLSARGIGAVIGGLAIAALAAHKLRGKMWAISSVMMPLVMIAFAATRWLPLGLFLMGLVGLALVTIMNNSNAMVQALVPDELRGRVMGLYSLMFMGGGPLGSLAVGLVAAGTDNPFAFYLCGGLTLVYAIGIFIFRPEVRAME